MPFANLPDPPEMDVAASDVLEAMRQTGGYLDVSPADVLAVYRLAYAHAAARLAREVPVSAIMTTSVTTVPADGSVLEAANLLAAARVSGAPVLDAGAVVGVLSLKDLLRLLGLPDTVGPAALIARLLDPATCLAPASPGLGERLVGTIMTAPAIVIAPDTPRSEAAKLMAAKGVNRLPVCDAERLCGIVSRGDVLRSCRGMEGDGAK